MVQIGHRGTAQNFQKSQFEFQNCGSSFFASVSPVYCKKKFDWIPTKLTEEIDFEVCPMVIMAMALLQQHDARRDILIEPAARRRAAIEALGRSELGAQSGRKNQPACNIIVFCSSCHTTSFIFKN